MERRNRTFSLSPIVQFQFTSYMSAFIVMALSLNLSTTRISCTLFTMLKNITLSAEESLIQQARRRAGMENSTLNQLFREWLEHYVAQSASTDQYQLLMQQLQHVDAGRKFTREEMNERH